jgi:hypothetical protein
MRRIAGCLLALALAVPAGAGTLDAQVRTGVAVGTSTPFGGFGDRAEEGFNVMGVLAIELPLIPIGLRGDLLYQQLPAVDRGHYRQLAGIVHARARVPLGILSPYLLGGVGLYHHRQPDTPFRAQDMSTEIGYSVGAGLQIPIPLLSPFVEVRFHTVPEAEGMGRTLPISVGLMF